MGWGGGGGGVGGGGRGRSVTSVQVEVIRGDSKAQRRLMSWNSISSLSMAYPCVCQTVMSDMERRKQWVCSMEMMEDENMEMITSSS